MTNNTTKRVYPQVVRQLLILVAVTAILSLLYGLQSLAGGPLRLKITSPVHDIVLSPDGNWLVSASEDGRIRLWNTQSQGAWSSRTLGAHDDAVVRLAFGPTSTTLTSAGRDGTIRQWDVDTGQQEVVVAAQGPLNDASVNGRGDVLATISADGVIQVWDLFTLQEQLSIQANSQWAVAISYDGALVAAGDGPNVQIWDARTGQPSLRLQGRWEDESLQEDWVGHDGEITALAFSQDGRTLASGGTEAVLIFWDLENAEPAYIGTSHYQAILALEFNQDGDILLSGSQDSKARTWRVVGGKSSATLVGHLNAVRGVAFGQAPDRLFSAGDDGTIREWETINNREVHVEWTKPGLTPLWNQVFGVWMLLSGLLGLLCLWGLWRGTLWGNLSALALYLLGPVIVLGLPLLEAAFFPFSWGVRLGIAWPLLVLAGWYTALILLLNQTVVKGFYEAPAQLNLSQQLARSRRANRIRFGLFAGAVWVAVLVILYSVLRQFNLDIAFMRHFFPFIMGGAGMTVYVSAASIALAVILALVGALGRLSKNPIANGVSGFYVSLIRGTPLLVQIYIWYLGLPRLEIVLRPIVAGILALGVNYGAYMTETFRAGIQAIGKGQHEAAQALGMSRSQTFRRIVLPQAFRIVIPPIGNDFIAMMKDSSLVSIMAVWELSFRAQKIGRQYFRSLETFIVAAAFYWLLTVIFQFLQGKLEDYMARGERR